MNVSTAISTVEIINADKDVDTDKLLDSNNKILDSPNNLDKVKSGQKTKKQKKDRPLLFVSNWPLSRRARSHQISAMILWLAIAAYPFFDLF
jgi:hypothetical protein